MYNFYTAFVTISVLVFIAIYNTSFITVVTLGGTVLGSALIGLCSALLSFLLCKALRKKNEAVCVGYERLRLYHRGDGFLPAGLGD